jgi:thioredoxin-related protein
VDGIEREFEGRLTVLHIDVLDPVGKEIGRHYGFKYTPTFILFDSEGEELWRTVGSINPTEVRGSLGEE